MSHPNHCKHEGCTCEVPQDRAAKGDKFCSDHCKQHGADPHAKHACSCGHTSCK